MPGTSTADPVSAPRVGPSFSGSEPHVDGSTKCVSRNTTIAMRAAARKLHAQRMIETTGTLEYLQGVWMAMFDAA